MQGFSIIRVSVCSFIVDIIYHLFTGCEGNSMFCDPETGDVS